MAEALAILAGSIDAPRPRASAARLLGASESALARIGALHQPSDKPEYDRIVAAVRARLDDAAFQAAWAQGREMTLQQAVAYALEDYQ
jgi:hypothetical protein